MSGFPCQQLSCPGGWLSGKIPAREALPQISAGFTLIELLVAMAVAGVLLSVGVPGFSDALKEGRISGQYNRLVGSLYLARSEAVKGPSQVTVCARKSKGSMECGTTSDWANGWIVFIDNTIVAGEVTAKIDTQDEIISVESAIKNGTSLLVFGTFTSSATDAADTAFVRYTIDGSTEWTSGSAILCDLSRGPDSSRAINILMTGDIRRGRVSGSETSPRDVFNQPISDHCPDPS